MAKELTRCQKRCQDCSCLKNVNGIWKCTECFEQKVDEIDDCPLGITLDEINEVNEKAKENKVKNTVRSKNGKPRQKREPKQDIEKEQIITQLADFMQNHAENVKITNVSKYIEFDLNGNHFKLDLIRQRKPKN